MTPGQNALLRRKLQLTWTGCPVGSNTNGDDGALLSQAVADSVECIAMKDELNCLRNGQRYIPTHTLKTSSIPEQYYSILCSAMNSLVSIYYHREGEHLTGIVNRVSAVGRVVMTSVLDECGYEFSACGEHYIPRVVLDFRGASLIHVQTEEEKRRHVADFQKSPIANIGSLVTVFQEFTSFTGVLQQVEGGDSKNFALWRGPSNMQEFHLSDITDGFEIQLSPFPRERIQYMTPKQVEAYFDLLNLDSSCQVHGSTVYAFQAPTRTLTYVLIASRISNAM